MPALYAYVLMCSWHEARIVTYSATTGDCNQQARHPSAGELHSDYEDTDKG